MNLHLIHDALQRFSSSQSVDEIRELLREFSNQLGFESFIYALRVPVTFAESRVVMIKGYPDEWLDRYFDHGYYAFDPVVAYCSQHIVPIQWHDLPVTLSADNERLMNEATEFGLRFGISMPVHSPHGELGILSMALDQKARAARDVTKHALPYVQLLASYLHEAVRRVLGLVEQESQLQLSMREQECLRWAADGKTSWEIARLLKVSERTVNFHLNNSMSKLDVCNRQHAIAKAVLHGLITPQPF